MSVKKPSTKRVPSPPPVDPTPFGVVGLGASAGGLASLESFFSALSTEKPSGLAFVVVQHLSPDYKSILPEIIRRHTHLPVCEVTDHLALKPDCVYVSPAHRDLAIQDNCFRLLDPTLTRGLRLVIDFFFRSLAQALHERAIGVVLSGTGSDGTLGARAIKGEGGMIMVQTPESAAHDGMPRSALASGVVDYVLEPEKMPAQLLAYARRALDWQSHPDSAAAVPKTDTLAKIVALVHSRTGNDFSNYKRQSVLRRLERRRAVHQLDSFEAYLDLLEKEPGEMEALFQDLLIGVTQFFRDPTAYAALQEKVIPQLFASKPAGSTVRVWVPACSTGEEAYSIAILLQEQMDLLQSGYKVQLFATDVDQRAIDLARVGAYPSSIGADVTPARLTRFFVHDPERGVYRINKSLRDMLIFSEQSLVRDPPFSRLDLISCRNLMIYLDRDLHKRILPLFHYALNPGGFLFLGTAETVGEFTNLFASLDRKEKLYRSKQASRSKAQVPQLGKLLQSGSRTAVRSSRRAANEGSFSLQSLTERALLRHFGAVGLLVGEAGDIHFVHGRTGLYLEPSPGEAGLNILKMAREGLRRPLTQALKSCVAHRQTSHHPGIRVLTNGDYTTVDLTVRSIETDATFYLVVIEVARAAPSPVAAPSEVGEKRTPVEAQVAELLDELRAKEEHLQATSEELETSNEELRSSNEEMQSINEELQSANEELETAKEELQSINEELSTVNAELQTRVAELSQSNNDMNNLLAGTGVGTIFVDHDLRIRRFTPAVTQIINLIPTDVGRSLGDIVHNLLNYQTLEQDVQAVLDTLVHHDQEVQSKSGHWFLLRIRPYRTLENVIEGAVIIFVDITQLKSR